MFGTVIAAIHSIALALIAGALCSEYFLFRHGMSEKDVQKVLIADLLHQSALILMIGSGFLRITNSIYSPAHYLDNDLFLLKLMMVATIALLSVYPSVTFWHWRSAIRRNQVSLITRHQRQLIAWSIRVELTLLLIIPLLSAAVRQGYS